MRVGIDDYRQKLERGLQSIIPSFVTSCLVLLSVIPYGLPVLNQAMPLLPLIAIFFWSIHCPTLCPIIFSFALGLLQDSLAGTPLGFSSALYLSMHALVGYQRTFFYDKNFLVLWCAFSVLMALLVLLGYLLLVIYHFALLPVEPIVIQLLVTVCVYPFLIRMLQFVMRYIMRRG